MNDALKSLAAVIRQRKAVREEGSYTCYLFEKGLDKILKKCGEECAELIIAAKNGDKGEIGMEACDLIYHMLVLLEETGVPLADIETELQKRAEKTGNLKAQKTVNKNS